MHRRETNGDDAADVLGLQALGWLLGDPQRSERFQALTGLDIDTVRARIGEPDLLAAVLGHLAGHEPDLIVCAAALDLKPAALVAAHANLERRCDRY